MDLSIATICHPPYIKYLNEHLSSLEEAIKDRPISIYLLNSQMTEDDAENLEAIVSDLNLENLTVDNTSEFLTVGEARNRLFDKATSEWILFLDSDTTLAQDYFDRLEAFVNRHMLCNVYGIAGGIGLRGHSQWGFFEGIMDIIALVGKVEGIESRIYEDIFAKFDFHKTDIKKKSPSFWFDLFHAFNEYDGRRIRYTQGFNQIFRKDVRINY